MKLVVNLKGDEKQEVDLGTEEELEKFDYIVENIRTAMVNKSEFEFKGNHIKEPQIRKYEDVVSFEIVL
ncbi:hypothetical protein MKZ02_19530 [Pseudobacillus sp. FSL P4-0506]|uniref:hypothetical protein n=1 Tax=Pseudobacillus sp. FSL P4-0506 TaxID=2921576 RepID=UPI0030FCD441